MIRLRTLCIVAVFALAGCGDSPNSPTPARKAAHAELPAVHTTADTAVTVTTRLIGLPRP